MLDRNAVKVRVERVHLEYLCNTFNLQYPSNPKLALKGFRPDLEGVEENLGCYFEVKSRIYPKDQPGPRKRIQSDFEWWSLEQHQIQNYERFAREMGLGLFWIFLLAYTQKRATQTENLGEDSFTHRNIYVLPWSAYELVAPAESGERHIGLAKLKREYIFVRLKVKKGYLFIAETIADKVDRFFVDTV